MASTEDPTRRPFHVRTDGGTFHSGRETEQAAQSTADAANRRATELGIKTRYIVVPKGA